MLRHHLFALSLALTTAGLAWSQQQQPAGTGTNPNQQQIQMHERMAKAHQDAAACLKQGRPLEECRAAMRAQCEQVGPENCPMGMMGKKGMGPMHGRGYGPRGGGRAQ